MYRMSYLKQFDETVTQLELILYRMSFWLDNVFVRAKSLRWDSFSDNGIVSYERLMGDHPVVPTREMPVSTSRVEASSRYLLDSNHRLHLLRPFLIGTNCERSSGCAVLDYGGGISGSAQE
jgi:hypothetical protein